MDLVLFFVFSTFEVLGVFAIMFALFRQKFFESFGKILFTAFVLDLVSFFLRFNVKISNIAIVILMITMIVCIMLLWQTQWFYAGMKVIMSYCIYLILQLTAFFAFNFGMVDLVSDQSVEIKGYILQFITMIISIVLGLIIRKLNWGWSFIPDGERVIKYKKSTNLALIFGMVFCILAFGSIVYISGLEGKVFFSVFFMILLFGLGGLIKLYNLKDVNDDD